jgi:hypothetical protein
MLLGYGYRRSYFTLEGLVMLTRLSCVFGFILISAYIIRGFGRSINEEYKAFIDQYNNANVSPSDNKKVDAKSDR